MRTTNMARGAIALTATAFLGYVAFTDASAQLVDPTPPTTAPPTTSATTTTTVPSRTGGNDDPGTSGPGVIPPGYAQIIASVKRSKPNNTRALVAAIQPLVDRGMTPEQAAVVGFGNFPVAGIATFTDDWFNPRYTPRFHLHEGTDIFAARDTPVRSPVAGVIRHANGGAGGVAAYVTTKEGHDAYFAHMSRYSDIKSGDSVAVGQVIGFVGASGNAAGGATHLHLELHPRGKGPVNPKPYLDQWIANALAAAPSLVARYMDATPPTTTATVPAAADAPNRPEPGHADLAWASSANPTGGSLRFAEHEATKAARQVDWATRARAADAIRRSAEQADAAARAMLRPLTPRGLLDVLGLGEPGR